MIDVVIVSMRSCFSDEGEQLDSPPVEYCTDKC